MDPRGLVGDWELRRRVADRHAGVTGTVRGRLSVDPDADELIWSESGLFVWSGGSRAGTGTAEVSRTYRLAMAGDGWWMRFGDGRPFHPWQPGSWVEHPCRNDTYRGLVRLDPADPDRMRVVWDVRGPAKHQRIVTRLHRSHRGGTSGFGES